MLMYGCVVHKRVWKEVPKENTPKLSTSQSRQPSPSLASSAGPRDTPFAADGFLFGSRRTGPDVVPSHCRPAFFICIQCWRHPRGTEPSSLPRSSSPVKLSPLSLAPPSRRIIGISLIRPSVEIIEGETKMSTPSADREVGFWIKDDV